MMAAERFRKMAEGLLLGVPLHAGDPGAWCDPVRNAVAAALAEVVEQERREIKEAIQKQIDTGQTLEEWEDEGGLKRAIEIIDSRSLNTELLDVVKRYRVFTTYPTSDKNQQGLHADMLELEKAGLVRRVKEDETQVVWNVVD
jgi:hypothetical protein